MVNDPRVINRSRILQSIRAALDRSPIVVLSGPRRCGKTTLHGTGVSRTDRVVQVHTPLDGAGHPGFGLLSSTSRTFRESASLEKGLGRKNAPSSVVRCRSTVFSV